MRFPYLTVVLTIGVFSFAVASSVSVYAVEGWSMAPDIEPGHLLFVNRRAFTFRPPQPGEILVFHRPVTGRVAVKRVAAYQAYTDLELRGDNTDISIDSRTYGGVSPDDVVGKVFFVGRGR